MISWFIRLIICAKVGGLLAAEPLLVELSIQGETQSPILVPNELSLVNERAYLLVVTNEQNVEIAFHFSQFGQHVLTHYLQGTANVTQNSMLLSPHGKLFWYFTTLSEGQFEAYASYPALNQKGPLSQMIILGEEKKLIEAPPLSKARLSLFGKWKLKREKT